MPIACVRFALIPARSPDARGFSRLLRTGASSGTSTLGKERAPAAPEHECPRSFGRQGQDLHRVDRIAALPFRTIAANVLAPPADPQERQPSQPRPGQTLTVPETVGTRSAQLAGVEQRRPACGPAASLAVMHRRPDAKPAPASPICPSIFRRGIASVCLVRLLSAERRIENADETEIAARGAKEVLIMLIQRIEGPRTDCMGDSGAHVDDFALARDAVVHFNVMLVLQVKLRAFPDNGVVNRAP